MSTFKQIMGLGFSPSPQLMKPMTARDYNAFVHEAYGPRIDAGTEFFTLAPVDADGRILRSVVLAEGSEGQVSFTVADLRRAVEAAMPKVAAVWMAHNHPSGSARPSLADLDMTEYLLKVFRNPRFFGGEVYLLDHVVVTPDPKVFTSIRGTTAIWENQRVVEAIERQSEQPAPKPKRKRAAPKSKRTPEQDAAVREAIAVARRMI